MLLLSLLACQDDTKPVDTAQDDSGYLFVDTSAREDSTDSAQDSADDSGADSSADSADDSGTDTAVEPPILHAWPSALTVHAGAVFPVRLVAEDADGARTEAPAATWWSDDTAVATVDATGTVTAVAAGTTLVHAALDGADMPVAVTVTDDGCVSVDVVDATTGAAVEGATVSVQGGSSATTDAAGAVCVPVDAGGAALTVTAGKAEAYDALTLVGVVGRDLVLPLTPKGSDGRGATVQGAVDYAGIADGGWTDVVVGFALASIDGALGAVMIDELFADTRSLTVFGMEMDLPANLFVEDSAADYAAAATEGPVAVWGVGGPVPIAELSSGVSGAGDALSILVDHLDAMTWGWNSGATAAVDAPAVLDIAPALTFDAGVTVSLPSLPAGFGGDESWLVLVAEERADEGWITTGIGEGTGTTSVATVADGTVTDSLGTAAIATAQAGGLGSGNPLVTVYATPAADGSYAFPEALSVPSIDAWDAASRTITVTASTDARWTRIRFSDDRKRIHDVIVPGGWSGALPAAPGTFHYPQSDITVTTLRLSDGAFETWAADGVVTPSALSPEASARTTWSR
jgi:hypothetical protein